MNAAMSTVNSSAPGAPFRPPTGPLRSGAFPAPNLADVNGPPTGWLAPLPGQTHAAPGAAGYAPVEITSVVPRVGAMGGASAMSDPVSGDAQGDSDPAAAPAAPGFGQQAGYPAPTPWADAGAPLVAPFDAPAGAIPLGPTPGATEPAHDEQATPVASAAPAAEPAPDSGIFKGAAGMVNLDALAELTTLDEIELLATQPMPSILPPSAAPGAVAGAQPMASAPTDAADAADALAAPVTAEVMAFPPAHGAMLRGLPYDTTPLPQMTRPLPIADLEASLRGAPNATHDDAGAFAETMQGDEARK
jgi:hypothetical protein